MIAPRRAAAIISAACLVLIASVAARGTAAVNDGAIQSEGYPATLSAYGFFTDLKARTPAPRVLPYALNTPLFSDYSIKQRYLYVPAGTSAAYRPAEVLDFPVGSALIKTFGYGAGAAFRPIETRLLPAAPKDGWRSPMSGTPTIATPY